MAIPLKEGVKPGDAAAGLAQRATEARNLSTSTAGARLYIYVNQYLQWVGMAESALRSVFVDSNIWNGLYSESYWQIRLLHEESPRAIELVSHELTWQAEMLDGWTDRLKKLSDRLEAAPGLITVVDTNVLLHYEPPAQVDWTKVVDSVQVRLVLPLRVVEELDEKKYAGRVDLADRSRRLLSHLRSVLEPTKGAPCELRFGVTIEVPIDDEPRRRPMDADQEILDTCREFRSGGQRVVLVTGDAGMCLRAVAQSTEVTDMPERYLRRKPSPESL